jgi:hypothetical protein
VTAPRAAGSADIQRELAAFRAGATSAEAKAEAQAFALRVLAARLEHGEADPDDMTIIFAA